MAGAFKTPCPSCEADVLVKGTNLIGRKIDCPKCKYRFTVPAPDGAADDGFEVVDKPKKKGNPKALVGIALGVLALAALAVGGYMMFGGEPEVTPTPPLSRGPRAGLTSGETPDKDSKTTPEKDPKPSPEKDPKTSPVNTKQGPTEVVNPDKIYGKENTAPKAAPPEILKPPAKMVDASNLLPGQTASLTSLNMDRLRATPLYGAFFDKLMLDFFQSAMTFEAADLHVVYLCLVDASREPFVVIRTKKPFSDTGITQKMDVKVAANSPIGKRVLYELKSNAFVTAMSRTFSTETLFNDAGVPITDEDKKRWQEKPLGLHYYDSQTLILGEMGVLDRWLRELEPDGMPPKQSIVAPANPVEPAPGAAPPAAAPGAGERGGKVAEGTPAPGAAPAEGDQKLFADKADFLSLKPELKLLMNRFNADEKNLPALTFLDEIENRNFFEDRELGGFELYAALIKQVLPTFKIVGVSVNQLSKDKLNATVLFNFVSAQDAKDTMQNLVLPLMESQIAPLLAQIFRTKLELKTALAANPMGLGALLGGRGAPPAATTPEDEFTNKSTIEVVAADRIASVDFDFHVLSDHYTKIIQPWIVSTTTQMKGRMMVLSGETNWHSLSTRYPRLATEKKPFPQGALKRVSNPGRFNQPWQPADRASFFVELLPYLNQGALYGNLKDQDRIGKAAWYDKSNLRGAATWIPQLLVPYYPQTSWRAYHPAAAGETLGATNYVALSGVGRDSARFNPASESHAKLVGITGYDWGSTPAEVKDGLSNTIYLIQAPPGHNRPWIAGGGATVMGVDSEGNPILDFVSADNTGKRGTHALMADGSVRFLPDSIDAATFRALVTRAGGESLGDLNAKTTLVPMPKNLEAELKGGGGGLLASILGKTDKNDRSRIDAPELLKFQGKWKVTYLFREGKAMTASEVEALALLVTVSDNSMTLQPKEGGAQKKTILRLDPKASPKRIYFENGDGSPDPMAYEFDGDKIKLLGWIQPDSADAYPKAMTPPTAGTQNVKYYEFTKVKE